MDGRGQDLQGKGVVSAQGGGEGGLLSGSSREDGEEEGGKNRVATRGVGVDS